MEDPLAVALKFGFIAVLYLFLVWVVRSARRDLARLRSDGGPREAAGDARSPQAAAGYAAASRPELEIVAAMGYEPGTRFEIPEGATLGRGDVADIRVEDRFASSLHARIFARNGFMYIEDMGSTNGTYVNGRQLSRAEQLHPADVIRIGDTEYRYQE